MSCTTEGFVYVHQPSGKFVYVGLTSTMVGYRKSASIVKDIDDASVFTGMPDRETQIELKKIGIDLIKSRLPVKVTRSVELTGWGIAS